MREITTFEGAFRLGPKGEVYQREREGWKFREKLPSGETRDWTPQRFLQFLKYRIGYMAGDALVGWKWEAPPCPPLRPPLR